MAEINKLDPSLESVNFQKQDANGIKEGDRGRVYMLTGLAFSSLALAVAYAVHSAYQSCMISGTPTDCGRLVGIVSGVVAGITIPIPFLLKAYFTKPQQKPSLPHGHAGTMHDTIIQIAEIRLDILLKTAQLMREAENQSDESQNTIAKELTRLAEWDQELKKKQSLLWEKIAKMPNSPLNQADP